MAKPILKPNWMTGYVGENAVEPTVGKKAAGWAADERPPAESFNWMFQSFSDWANYLDEISGKIESLNIQYKAIVGTISSSSPATHATLAAALADVAVPNGSKILVLETQNLAAPVTISKNFIEIEFASNVSLVKSAGSIGLIIQGVNTRIKGGRIASYSTVGDKAIQVQAGAKNTILRDIVFANCNIEIEDLSTNTSILGCFTEE
jgi:hypothetical protein